MLSVQSEGQQLCGAGTGSSPTPRPSSTYLLVKRKPHAHLYTASTYTTDFFVRPKWEPVRQPLREMTSTERWRLLLAPLSQASS